MLWRSLLLFAVALAQAVVALFLFRWQSWPIGVKPDLLLALGMAAAARGRTAGDFFLTAWLCGLLHDLIAGARLGVNALLFLAAAWPAQAIAVRWRERPFLRAFFIFALISVVSALRTGLENGRFVAILESACGKAAILNAAAVLPMFFLCGFLLGKTADGK